ncbi:MAG TPA: hypothetical protein VMX17_08120 [Candidatus Glassbacteria bacterium]|nr:hypothetical protein [Candidatus Glassbacteria bacterium]
MKDKLTKAFLKSYKEWKQFTPETPFLMEDEDEDFKFESEGIELDNLDWAKLVLKEGSETEIEVENEHGTRFPISDLSKTEIEIFLTVL